MLSLLTSPRSQRPLALLGAAVSFLLVWGGSLGPSDAFDMHARASFDLSSLSPGVQNFCGFLPSDYTVNNCSLPSGLSASDALELSDPTPVAVGIVTVSFDALVVTKEGCHFHPE